MTAFSIVVQRAAHWPLPVDASAHGVALDAHLLLNLAIAAGLLLLAHLVLIAGLWRRRSAQQPHTHWIEAVPLGLLALLFGALAVRAQQLWGTNRITGADPAAMQVEAVGQQFAWTFRYPGADASFGRTSLSLVDPANANPLGLDPSDEHATDDIITSTLAIPVGRPVDLTLRSHDVIHGFSVPQLRIKQNAVPGQPAHIHFTATTPGTYAILCTQVCGIGHARMEAQLIVMEPKTFASWLEGHQHQGRTAVRP